MSQQNQALVRLSESARQMITTPEAMADRIREWREIAHVLTPAVQISAMAPQHAISVAVVQLDTEVDRKGIGPEVYSLDENGKGVPWLSRGEVSIGKVGLLKIASAAAITWDPRYCGRTDDRKERYYWEYRAIGSVVGFDGAPLVLPPGTFELDLRDGSPTLKGMGPAQIDAMRRSGLRICEAKAINAAIRGLGLRQKYQRQELEKPFVIFRVTFLPDMKDPMQRQLVAERALGASSTLYPQARQIGAGRTHPDIDVEPERDSDQTVTTTDGAMVNAGTGEVVEEQKREERRTPPEPPANAPRVTDVRQVQKTDKYTLYEVVLSDGRKGTTFDKGIVTAAEGFKASAAAVECTIESVPGKGRNEGKTFQAITEIGPWQPTMFDDDSSPY